MKATKPTAQRGRFSPGVSGNPGGRPKAVKALLELARAEVPKSFDLAVELRDDTRQEPRVRLEAAKFLCAYGLGSPPKLDPTAPEDATAYRGEGLTVEERRAIARMKLSTEQQQQPPPPPSNEGAH